MPRVRVHAERNRSIKPGLFRDREASAPETELFLPAVHRPFSCWSPALPTLGSPGMCHPLAAIATSIALAAASAHAQIAKYAKDAPGTKEPPEIKRVEGSVVLHFAQKKFDEFTIPTGRVVFEYGPQQFNDWPRIRVEGSRTTLFYRQPKDATTLEVQRSYEEDLAGKGFEKIFAGSSNDAGESERNELDNGYGRFLAQVYTSEMDQDLQKYTMPPPVNTATSP